MKRVNEIRVVLETDQKVLAHGNSLRGFISKHFPQNPLLTNHMEDGRTIYIFPRVQYRILENRAIIIGVEEGIDVVSALADHFDYLELGSKKYPILKKIVTKQKVPVGISPRMISYRFLKPWLALNKNNYSRYKLFDNFHDKKQLLRNILTANLLSLAKGIEANILENIVVDRLELRP
ncbi:MAG: hypothetical protein DRH43_05280 [Deltaproteobacteria bacterium]|nr:MAG: hypothetical protein DRH43_05280 [Deltaproteobacteria bacterium]